MTYMTRCICLVLLCLMLAACGQNGPLTLPEQSPAAQQNTPSEGAKQAVPDAAQDGEPLPDAIPQAEPDPAEVSDDESI